MRSFLACLVLAHGDVDLELSETCESCLAKGGGWCTLEQRCVEDDVAHCAPEARHLGFAMQNRHVIGVYEQFWPFISHFNRRFDLV